MNSLIVEIIKRILLLHIILYDNPIKLDKIILIINNEKEIYLTKIIDKNSLLLTSKNKILIPHDLKETKYLNNIISTTHKKKYACLISFIFSRLSNIDIHQRFIYSWLSFDGFVNSKNYFNTKTDAHKLSCFIEEYYSNSKFLEWRNREKISKFIIELIDDSLNVDDFLNANSEEYTLISNKLKELNILDEINVKVFLMVDFSYYLRCKFFHANNPIPLIIIENDKEIKAMKIAQQLLDTFLSQHIVELFLWQRALY